MNKLIDNKLFFIIAFVIILLLSSCSSKYLNISTKYSKISAWKSDSSAFAFVAVNEIYRLPEGIAKFPDGGKTKTEYFDVALYYYNLENEKLNRAVDFKNIFILYPKNREYLTSIKIAFSDFLIYYKLSDADDYSIREAKKSLHNDNDSTKLNQAIQYVSKIHIYNVNTKKISGIDSLPANVQWAGNKQFNDLKNLQNNCLQKISYSDWGISLSDIYPQSKNTYMDYIILGLYNKNIINAIYEQVVPGFSQEDREHILEKMEKRKQKLLKIFKKNSDGPYQESLKKEKYENYIKYVEETKKRLKQTNQYE